MKSFKYWLTKLPGLIGRQTANLIEAITTGTCSVAAFASLFLLDGWGGKLGGFVGFFILAYFIAYVIDKVQGSL